MPLNSLISYWQFDIIRFAALSFYPAITHKSPYNTLLSEILRSIVLPSLNMVRRTGI